MTTHPRSSGTTSAAETPSRDAQRNAAIAACYGSRAWFINAGIHSLHEQRDQAGRIPAGRLHPEYGARRAVARSALCAQTFHLAHSDSRPPEGHPT